jgi:putative protease
VTVTDDAGRQARVFSDTPVQTARKHPLSEDVVREQFGRLGETPFTLRNIELTGDLLPTGQLGVMVPKSVMNDLRRRAVAALLALRDAPPRPAVHAEALVELREAARQSVLPAADRETAVAMTVLVRSPEQFRAVLAWQPPAGCARPAMLYCDFEEVRFSKTAVIEGRAAGLPVALATPRILKPGEEGLLQQILNCGPDAILVRNLAAIGYFQEQAPGLPLVGDYALNVANELTAALFAERGLVRLVPSYDLNLQQLRAMLGRISPELFEVVVHQHMPMFHMEHCVFAHTLSNGKDFHDCGRPCDEHRVELRDHVGESHPLVADVGCRNTVFNAQAQSAGAYVPQLQEWGVRRFRVELLRESAAETRALLDSYAGVLQGESAGLPLGNELRVLNQLGVVRGTLDFA